MLVLPSFAVFLWVLFLFHSFVQGHWNLVIALVLPVLEHSDEELRHLHGLGILVWPTAGKDPGSGGLIALDICAATYAAA